MLGAIETVTGIAFSLPSLILIMHTVLISLLVVGLILVASRLAFFWMCPFIIKNASIFATVVNAIIFFLEIFADAAIAVIDGT